VTRVLGSRYILASVVGRGAMGEVWQGQSRAEGDQVAVKILRAELADDPALVARFVQERSILLGLSGPHLVAIRDMVLEGDTLAIVMEYVPGSDLRRFLIRNQTLPPALAAELVAQICDGLAIVHAAGVIHRDLKPENVLLDLTDPTAPIAKVSDFGVSRITYGPRLTQLTGLIGTPEYMAPEVAEQGPATPAADLYSAGILLYELLAGRTPFAGGHPVAVLRRHLEASPPPIAGLPGELWTMIESLLAKEPAERPLGAAVVAEHLRALSADLRDLPALPAQELPGHTGATPAWLTPLPDEVAAATQLRRPKDGDEDVRASSGSGDPRGLIADLLGAPDPQYETQLGARAPGKADRSVPPGHTRSRKRRMARVLIPTALVVVAAGIYVPIALTSGGKHAATAASPVSYSFDPQQYPDGLLVSQRWSLMGDGSHFEADLVASNSTDHPLNTSFDLAIPKSLATSASRDITFTPSPKIISDDPVVAYNLNLAAHGQQNLKYSITTPADGANVGRLQQWAADVAKVMLPGPKPTAVRLTSIKIEPGSLPAMKVGKTSRLTLAGTVDSGKAAPAAALSGAAWTTSNPSVISLTQTGQTTTISAKAPGTSAITAKVGDTQAQPLTVTVTAAGSSSASPTASIPSSSQIRANGGPSTHSSPPKPTKPSTVVPPPPAGPGPQTPNILSLDTQASYGSNYLRLELHFCTPGQGNTFTYCPNPGNRVASNPSITTYVCPEGNCAAGRYPGLRCESDTAQTCYVWGSLNVSTKSWRVFVEFSANGKTTSATDDSMPPIEVENATPTTSGVVSIVTCDIVSDANCNDGKPAASPTALLCASSVDCNSVIASGTPTKCGQALCWTWTGLGSNTIYYVTISAYCQANPTVSSELVGLYDSGR
jgi:serine/threonine protein kinase